VEKTLRAGLSRLAQSRPVISRALLCTSFATITLGANLWIIAAYGNATPYWDDWDAFAAQLYAPYGRSELTFASLLAPHDEHRLFVPRALSLALTTVNGLWDPISQMIVNAALHVALGVFILITFGKKLDGAAFAGLMLLMLGLMSIPTASENLIWQIITEYYGLLLFGCISIWLLTRHPGFSGAAILGIGAAVLAFLSLASGAFVFLACAVILAVKRWLRTEQGWRPWVLAAALFAMFVIAAALTPSSAGVRARSVAEFYYAWTLLAGWPFNPHLVIAPLLVNAPWMFFAVRTLRHPPSPSSPAWAVLGVGLWIGLQYLALAYGRGAAINATRYFDICVVGIIFNYISAVALITTTRDRALTVGWLSLVAIGCLVQTATITPNELHQHHVRALVQEANVRSFLTTGRFPPTANIFDRSIPYPDADKLADVLSDPAMRRFLPGNLQSAIPIDPSGAVTPAPQERLLEVREMLLAAAPYLVAVGGLLLLGVLASPWLPRRASPSPTARIEEFTP
jgi:hypothetical protein